MLRAGRAEISLDQTGEAVRRSTPTRGIERGTGLDARAFLVIRGWVQPVVRVPITDPTTRRRTGSLESSAQRTGRRDQRITTA